MKNLRTAFVILCACVLSGCAKIKISDIEVCGDKGPAGAVCFHTLSDEERTLTREQWDEARIGRLSMDSTGLSETFEAILKLCNRTKQCSFEEKKLILQFIQKAHKADFEIPVSFDEGA